MDWIEFESFWLFCPDFADIFVRCQTLEGFEPSGVIVGIDQVRLVAFLGYMRKIHSFFTGF